MNHDAAHCFDMTDDCPDGCYRARLTRDAKARRLEFVGVPLDWAHFRDSRECPLRPAEWLDLDAAQAYCSKCLHPIDAEKKKAYSYCPWCGEKMMRND